VKKNELTFVALLIALCAALGHAQSTHRPASAGDDISGAYAFLHDGESIELNVDHGKLSGWVSSFGFLESDKDTLLDRFFEKASLEGKRVYFISKRIHGCWVEFNGHVERGEGRVRGAEGYYVLTGTLTQYTTDSEVKVSARQRQVVFKSAADPSVAENSK